MDIGPTVHAAAPNAVCHSCESNFTDAGGIRWMGNEEVSILGAFSYGQRGLSALGKSGGLSANRRLLLHSRE